MLKKILKISTIAIIILVIIGAIAYYFLGGFKKGAEYTTVKVERGLLTQSVEATGKVESVDQIELNFKTTGRIFLISSKVGDRVAKNQILARLESGALQSRVIDARAQVAKAKADYDQLIAGASNEDVKVTQDTVEQKKQDIATAQNNLASLKIKRDTELLNLKETVLTVAYNELITAQGAMEQVDNTLDDPDAKDTLSVKNTGLISITRSYEEDANKTVSDVINNINSLTSISPDSVVLAALSNTKVALQKVITALSSTLDALLATNTSTSLSEAELDTLKTNIKTQQANISASKTSIQTAESNWTNKTAVYEDEIITAEDSINVKISALQVAESQLILKKSQPRQFEIDSANAKINQAEATLTLAIANLEDAVIKAPIAGVITKKNYENGEQSSLSEPVLEMIGESTLQIEGDISESDIVNIKTGQEAEVTLDAFSDENLFLGTVSFINPAETIIQDVVYYKIKVQLNEQYEEIKPGMTANVKIITAEKDGVIFVPFRAVKSKNGDKYIDILINNLPVTRTVELGLRGDEGVEILSGVEEGENVVTFVKE